MTADLFAKMADVMTRPDAALLVFNASRELYGLPPVPAIPKPCHLTLVADDADGEVGE